MNKAKNLKSQGRTDLGMNSVGWQSWCISAPTERYIAGIDIFNKKMYCNHRCPNSVYLNILLLIKYLSAIETLVCLREFSLTLYHTIPTFNDPEEVAFWKHYGKRRKCWKPAFSPFPRMFSTLPKTNYSFSVNFILSSASAFKLDWSKIVSFGKELRGSTSFGFAQNTIHDFQNTVLNS